MILKIWRFFIRFLLWFNLPPGATGCLFLLLILLMQLVTVQSSRKPSGLRSNSSQHFYARFRLNEQRRWNDSSESSNLKPKAFHKLIQSLTRTTTTTPRPGTKFVECSCPQNGLSSVVIYCLAVELLVLMLFYAMRALIRASHIFHTSRFELYLVISGRYNVWLPLGHYPGNHMDYICEVEGPGDVRIQNNGRLSQSISYQYTLTSSVMLVDTCTESGSFLGPDFQVSYFKHLLVSSLLKQNILRYNFMTVPIGGPACLLPTTRTTEELS